jgi:hypothetical protein
VMGFGVWHWRDPSLAEISRFRTGNISEHSQHRRTRLVLSDRAPHTRPEPAWKPKSSLPLAQSHWVLARSLALPGSRLQNDGGESFVRLLFMCRPPSGSALLHLSTGTTCGQPSHATG